MAKSEGTIGTKVPKKDGTSVAVLLVVPKGLPKGALLRPLGEIAGLPKGALLRALTEITSSRIPEDGKSPIGSTEPETGRPVLQDPANAETAQAEATAEHPEIRELLERLVDAIEGAELTGARAEKDEDRLEEKIEDEGQSPRTVRDYSGFRIAVDSPAAKDAVVAALRKQFDTPDEQDEWDEGNAETGFHGHTVQVHDDSSPVTHEVQVLPLEVAEHADDQHDLYEKAREGDKGAAAALKQVNETNWNAFQKRQGGGDAVREQSAGGVLQHPSEGAGEAGRGRGRVEPGKQGHEAAGARPDPVQGDDAQTPGERFRKIAAARKENAVTPVPATVRRGDETPPRRVTKGAVVALGDGRAGVIEHWQPAVNGMPARARVRTADGRTLNSVKPDAMTVVTPRKPDPEAEWIGVDMDKTLAVDHGFKGAEIIGKPIPAMVERVKQMLADGEDVRIFTARVSTDKTGKAQSAIEAWSQQYLGEALPITNVKDAHMKEFWDDRARQVEPNTGRKMGSK